MESRKSYGTLEGIPDLPTVPDRSRFRFALHVKSLLSKVHELGLIHLNSSARSPFDMSLPDFDSLPSLQWWVIERHVDTRLESFIENADPVSSQKQHAFIVL